MANNRIPIEADNFYHIYNHAVGKENLFENEQNYLFFLQKFAEYFNPVVETFAYCLMPNHFHFIIRLKKDSTLIDFYTEKYPKFSLKNSLLLADPTDFQNPQGLKVLTKQNSQHFGNFFNSYAKAFNGQHKRRGALFLNDFHRKIIDNIEYLKKLVHYIHYNPVIHGFAENILDWKYSSYQSFFSMKNTNIERQQVIDWFEDIENFISFHKKNIDDFEPNFD